MKSRKRKKNRLMRLFMLPVFLLACFGAWQLYGIYGSSREHMSEEELFGVSGDRAAIMYNYELQSAGALYRGDECYLPVEWVQTILNKRFYWDEAEELLVYVLPEQVVKLSLSEEQQSEKPLFIYEQEKLWLSETLIRRYTDIRMEPFTDGEVKRIFVGQVKESDAVAGLRGHTVMRSRPSGKGAIVRELQKGDSVRIIPDHPNAATDTERWQRVMSEDGITGYIRVRKLYAAEQLAVPHDFVAPEYSAHSLDGKLVLGWHQVSNVDANRYLGAVTDRADGLRVISPTWFSLRGNEGEYQSLASRSYVDAAHAKGLQVWALLDNFDSSVTLGTLLKRSSVREKLISSLMADAERYGFDGINLDFELLRRDAVKQYLEFVRELSVACRARGLYLSVDVPNPASYNWHYDRAELSVFCDYVINMGYDEHTAGDDMGSSSSLPFFTGGIEDSLREIPGERFVAAVPFYTRLWKKAGDGTLSSEALSMKGAQDWVQKNAVQLDWDETLGQYTGNSRAEDGSTAYIWMEEARSMQLKLDAVRSQNIAGVACWRLGLETDDMWGIVGKQ